MSTTLSEFEPIKPNENGNPSNILPPDLPSPETNSSDSNVSPEKKRRGRPKKSETQNPSPDSKSSPLSQDSPSSIFDQIKKEVSDNERTLSQAQGDTINPQSQTQLIDSAKNVIDGYILLTIADTFFPFLLKMFFKKSKRVKDSDIRLSKDQKEHLQPIADEVAVSLLSWLDPFTLFFVLTGAMYYMNMEDAVSRLPVLKEKEEK
jgi:hypothetical protein